MVRFAMAKTAKKSLLTVKVVSVHVYSSTLYRQNHSLSPTNQQVDISVWNQNIMNRMTLIQQNIGRMFAQFL